MNEKEQSLRLLVVLMKAHHSVLEVLQADMKRHGLNPSAFAVLELLYHKGEQPIQHLGKRILLTSGSLTYVVDKLEEKGLLNRRRCTEDRRVIYAVISEEGKRLMDEIFPLHRDKVNDIFQDLSAEEKENMTEMLKRIGLNVPR